MCGVVSICVWYSESVDVCIQVHMYVGLHVQVKGQHVCLSLTDLYLFFAFKVLIFLEIFIREYCYIISSHHSALGSSCVP